MRTKSYADSFRNSTPETKARLIASITADEAAALRHHWEFWARPNQLAPIGVWRVWLLLAGRGFGKTRTGAEWIRHHAESGKVKWLSLVAPTAADARDIMVEGESGILAISPPDTRPHYSPANRKLTWPNGAQALIFTADEPDRLRGKQHEKAWAEELAAWRYPDSWDQLWLGLRLGTNPQCVVTTTPRPTKQIRALVKDADCRVTRGTTYENASNLASGFIERIKELYEGTRLGRQELHAEILDDAAGALWRRDNIDANRVKQPPDLIRVVVAIDPAATSKDSSDETGIVVAGVAKNGHAYVLDDCSGRYSPDGWARKAVDAYGRHRASRIVAETNNGGDMVQHTLRTVDKDIPYRAVHASRGKRTRAEPIAALYEQHKIHHVGAYPDLEDQLCTWDATDGSDSPDRLDALVWALTALCKPCVPGAYGAMRGAGAKRRM